ncbi:hypothetical protein CAAN1_01S14246 [[Candida] anglica]|uniref:Uncharacterized protein n=1 Tax=[Candida] anglica TaxID=148631 RepID=A0ABP0EP64_9ASCO
MSGKEDKTTAEIAETKTIIENPYTEEKINITNDTNLEAQPEPATCLRIQPRSKFLLIYTIVQTSIGPIMSFRTVPIGEKRYFEALLLTIFVLFIPFVPFSWVYLNGINLTVRPICYYLGAAALFGGIRGNFSGQIYSYLKEKDDFSWVNITICVMITIISYGLVFKFSRRCN